MVSNLFVATRCVTLAYDSVHFDRDDVLGRGAGGTVYRGTYRGEAVAVKEIKDGQEQEALEETEVCCMKS